MKSQPKLEVLLLTGRTIEQGTGKETGKFSYEYLESVSTCQMDPNDMKFLKIKDNDKVKITTDYGSVILKVIKSKRAPHSRIIFIPYGPWASLIANPETHGTGMPSLKGETAEVIPASKEKMLDLLELIKMYFIKE